MKVDAHTELVINSFKSFSRFINEIYNENNCSGMTAEQFRNNLLLNIDFAIDKAMEKYKEKGGSAEH